MLTKPHDAEYGLPVWSPQGAARQIAPMITPAYPAMNSTLSVSRQTLQILQTEFERGHAIVDSFWKQYQANPEADIHWDALFEPSDFFISYPVRAFFAHSSTARRSTRSPRSPPFVHHHHSTIYRFALSVRLKMKPRPGAALSNRDCAN
jgi:poly(A) polymerase Pap1